MKLLEIVGHFETVENETIFTLCIERIHSFVLTFCCMLLLRNLIILRSR